jgi:phosphoserine phosphatase
LARKLGITKELLDYDRLLEKGRITKEECLRRQFGLFRGTRIEQALEWLQGAPRVKGVREAVRRFKSHGLTAIVLSDNFTIISDFFLRFGFDRTLGSKAYVRRGVLAGKGTVVADKLGPLRQLCRSKGISLGECIHVGDWDNDIPVFRAVGLSVAINPKNGRVSRSAKVVVETDNLLDVYEKVRSYLIDMK